MFFGCVSVFWGTPQNTETPKKEVPPDRLVQRRGITYEINSQTPFTGSSVSYYENGQLEVRENYKDGKVEGLYEGYYENGQLEERGNLKDGKEEGLFASFFH